MADGGLITIPYRPRPQFAPFHARKKRWSVTAAHRRAGKTVARVNDLIRAALTLDKPDPRFAYVAPLYTQAKDIAWGYLKHYGMAIPGAEPNESELRLDFPNGGRVRLYGADNYERMRGIYLDGACLDEYGDMDPRAFPEVIRPALSDRQGWGDFGGTPKGRNHFHELIYGDREGRWCGAVNDPDWYVAILKASETGILAADELADARKMMTPEQYAQEYECSFEAAILGAYYGKEIAQAERDGRITSVPHDPAHAVQTWWDLGYDDSTAIWFVQYVGRELRALDYYEASGEALPHYVKHLDAKPYRYGDHVLPHDVDAHELGTGRTRRETLHSLGLRNVKVIPAQDIMDGINAARLLLPRCWFDAAKCARGLEALRQYRADWDEKNKILRNKPMHNWASHGADAFRTGALGGNAPASIRPVKRERAAVGAWLG